MDRLFRLIEEAKDKAKSEYGEGHYAQTSFWHFILAVEKFAKSKQAKKKPCLQCPHMTSLGCDVGECGDFKEWYNNKYGGEER